MNLKLLANKYEFISILSIGVALRAIVGLHGYSGKGKPPTFGDYEAQRHWQEITINLDVQEWYKNSSMNDLLYWGLDYPPLTAYHSYILGRVAQLLDENYVKLNDSRGFESKDHKAFMRLTVLAADLIIYIPAVITLGFALQKVFNISVAFSFTFLLMIYPGQILIDNGHFQYNNISLGLAALAIAAALKNQDYLAALYFSLALNYKQMELYHALPFFFYLLRKSIIEPGRMFHKLQKLGLVASVVIFTFSIIWLPWIRNVESIFLVIKRLFPIGRGVFEDKVANFWCALNVVFKIKYIFSNEHMAMVCLFTTAAIAFPINVTLLATRRKERLLWALTNTALSFFLFSFQVHEKSILLAVLPASCLIPIQPFLALHLLHIAAFSMVPLFVKDGLAIAFFALYVIFFVFVRINWHSRPGNLQSVFCDMAIGESLVLSVVLCSINPPLKYPFLWPLLVSLFSFLNLILCLIFGIYNQLR